MLKVTRRKQSTDNLLNLVVIVVVELVEDGDEGKRSGTDHMLKYKDLWDTKKELFRGTIELKIFRDLPR